MIKLLEIYEILKFYYLPHLSHISKWNSIGNIVNLSSCHQLPKNIYIYIYIYYVIGMISNTFISILIYKFFIIKLIIDLTFFY